MTPTRRRTHRSQPVAGFCHHGLRSTQVVAFLLRQGPALAYKLAGGGEATPTRVGRLMTCR
ncbi:MAG TPA: hypothetical protein VFY73_20935 [Ideonella sp.]|uniref:hypothetical protein n=1 Tax=Ideonella sp. TaxID=1929293 RepID=UPI002E35E750|nr:hypothetical protein [Ideonella sp.]HEX5686502.1 hypothetical protein [Ideonella sp.]